MMDEPEVDFVSRVGGAILLAETQWTPKAGVSKERAMALAAIDAMREPTAAMTGAIAFGSYTTFSYGGDENSFEYISDENAAEIWRDMISAALSA